MSSGRTHRYSHFPVIGCSCHTCNYCRDKIGMADAQAEGAPELLQGFDTMTTTPDSRIRADWNPDGTPYDTADRHLWPMTHIDTSTTAGKISVMAAYERGEPVQARRLGLAEWSVPKTRKDTGDDPCWDWSMYDYRIATLPVVRTALQRAREHRSAWKGAHNPDSLHLEPLLREIDAAPAVMISMQTIGFETEANPYPAIVQWIAGDPKAMQPGRYRLVRDDD